MQSIESVKASLVKDLQVCRKAPSVEPGTKHGGHNTCSTIDDIFDLRSEVPWRPSVTHGSVIVGHMTIQLLIGLGPSLASLICYISGREKR